MTNIPPVWDRVLARTLLTGVAVCLLCALGSALLYGADGHEYQGLLLLVAILLFGPSLLAVLGTVAVARRWKCAWLLRGLPLIMLASELVLVRRFIE
jgi:hypothetical protein